MAVIKKFLGKKVLAVLMVLAALGVGTSAFAAQISPITYVKSTVSVGSTQDSLKLTWKYVDLAYGYNVYIDGVKQPGNPLKDANVSVVDDGISYYQQWAGYVSKGTTHTVKVTTVYPTGVETDPYVLTITAP
jgi:hypothetical protein